MAARTLTIDSGDCGPGDSAPGRIRLDVFVAAELGPEFSRAQATRMIKAGLVRLNGVPGRPADAVRAGDKIEIENPSALPAETSRTDADAPAIEVLHADDEIVVVNKPAGMTVHPAPGHPGGTLVDALLARFPEMATMAEPGGVMRPGIVHRLDKDTSGVMVVARTPFARMELARQFKDRAVSKIYLAVVRGLVGRERFSIARPVGRHPIERKRMSVNSRHGREALSEVSVLASNARGGRQRDAGWSTAADRPHPSDSRASGVDWASLPCRPPLWRPPNQGDQGRGIFGGGMRVRAPGAACDGAAD